MNFIAVYFSLTRCSDRLRGASFGALLIHLPSGQNNLSGLTLKKKSVGVRHTSVRVCTRCEAREGQPFLSHAMYWRAAVCWTQAARDVPSVLANGGRLRITAVIRELDRLVFARSTAVHTCGCRWGDVCVLLSTQLGQSEQCRLTFVKKLLEGRGNNPGIPPVTLADPPRPVTFPNWRCSDF